MPAILFSVHIKKAEVASRQYQGNVGSQEGYPCGNLIWLGDLEDDHLFKLTRVLVGGGVAAMVGIRM